MFTRTKYQIVWHHSAFWTGERRQIVLYECDSFGYAVKLLSYAALIKDPGDTFGIRVKTQLCEFIKEN